LSHCSAVNFDDESSLVNESDSCCNRWLLIGAVLGGLAVALGAFGAHGLEARLAEPGGILSAQAQRQLANWETAARYQMYHALASLAVGCIAERRRSKILQLAGIAMISGTIIFSGCLYALVLTGQRFWGAIVPIGGVLLLVGWGLLAIAVARQ